ncbi:hypothetical protein ABIC30_002700 [Methylobacterium sp. 1030]
MLAFAGDEAPVYRFTPEEEAELDESGAAEARGDRATDAEIRAIWAKVRRREPVRLGTSPPRPHPEVLRSGTSG